MKLPQGAKPVFRLWVEAGGVDVFGGGRAELMDAVERLGSLNRASKELGMSYRAAWGKIKIAEERLGFKLLDTRTSGKGRGSQLTSEAKDLLGAFHTFKTQAGEAIDREFKSAFSSKR